MAQILVVENDARLAKAIKDALVQIHHQVTLTPTANRAYQLLAQTNFELVLLDRMLDDGDGFELATWLVSTSPATKLIFLTQKGELPDRLQGLRAGADDYLAKPFDLMELQLKLQKLLQMEKQVRYDYVQAGEILLYPETGALLIADRPRQLRRRESEILRCLLKFRGRIVTRETLIEHVWKTEKNIPTHTTLDVYIRRLRLHLGPQASLIKTIRGYGYLIQDNR